MPFEYLDGPPKQEGRQQMGTGYQPLGGDPTPMTITASFLQPLNSLAVGLPEEILHWSLKASGVPLTEDSARPIRKLFGTDFEPGNQAERTAHRAGILFRDNLAALVPLYKGADIASRAVKSLDPRIADRVRQELFKFVQNNPKASAFFEQLSATTAGVFGQTAEEAGVGPLGQFGAELVGGGAASALQFTPTALAVRAFQRAFSPAAVESSAKAGIGRQLAKSLDERGEANLVEANRVFDELGATHRPTLAEATGEPSLLARQRQIESEASGSTLNTLTRRKQETADEILSGDRFSPERSGNEPEVIVNAVNRRVEAVRASNDQALNAAETERLALEGAIPATDRVSGGSTLRDRRSELRSGVMGDFVERADDIGLNSLSVRFPFEQFKTAVVDSFFVRGSVFANQAKPEILKRIRKYDKPDATYEDLQAIRTSVNDEYMDAVENSNRNAIRVLKNLRTQFDDYFDNVDPVGDVDIGAWRQFRGDYKTQLVDRFERGVAFKVGQRNRQGDYRILDEKIADTFLVSETAAVDFKRLYGGDDAAMVAMRAAIIDKARQAAVKDGVLDRRALSNFINRTRALGEFPQVKQELTDLAASAKALSARESQLRQRGLMLDRMSLSTALNGDVDGFIAAALRDPSVARTVSNTARRNNLQTAVNASVWQQAIKQIDTPDGELPNPARLLTWINNNEASLKRLVSPRYLGDLRNVYSGLAIIERTPLPRGRTDAIGPLEQLEQTAGTGIPQISSRIFAAQSGRVGYRYMAVDAGARFFNRVSKRRQDQLLYEALFDEKLARDLAELKKFKELSPSRERRMNAWLFTIGLPEVDPVGFGDIPQ